MTFIWSIISGWSHTSGMKRGEKSKTRITLATYVTSQVVRGVKVSLAHQESVDAVSFWLSLRSYTMPGTKQRNFRRRKRQCPAKRAATSLPPSSTTVVAPVSTDTTSPLDLTSTPATTTSAASSTSETLTASEKKLSKSISTLLDEQSSDSELYEGRGVRLLELEGLQSALSQSIVCKECGEGPVVIKERQEGLCTKPALHCESCGTSTEISFSTATGSMVLALNRKAVLANKCIGGSHSSLKMFLSMLDAPSPVSTNIYTQYNKEICEKSHQQALESMKNAREEIRKHYGAASSEETVDILVSCDGTCQKRGFTSLFGAVFIIAYETGKVVDYIVLSKYCAGCSYWEKQDKLSDQYKDWKASHECDANFSGSAGAIEPNGALLLFKRSLDFHIRYMSLVSDGDSKTMSLLQQEAPYGADQVTKMDCVGHVQKRIGTALRNLKVQHRGQKLSDGKTIGGVGRLTDNRINSLQNYYGDAIRRNKG